MSFAKVAIVGNLGQDPESRYLQTGTLVVSFSIAARGRRRQGAEPSTTWFRVSAFGDQAERIANMVQKGYIGKGRLLYVEGQLESRPYQGNDGQMRTSLDVTLTDWQFIGSGQQDQQGGNQNRPGSSGQFDPSQGGGSNYGGSDFGNQYGSEDDQSDLNEVPF